MKQSRQHREKDSQRAARKCQTTGCNKHKLNASKVGTTNRAEVFNIGHTAHQGATAYSIKGDHEGKNDNWGATFI